MPYPPGIECRWGAAAENAIFITARDGGKPRMKVGRRHNRIKYGDRLRPEMRVHGVPNRLPWKVAGEIKMRDLPARMHAGIGSACSGDRDALARKPGDGLLQRRLNRGAILLALPPGIGTPVIFYGQ